MLGASASQMRNPLGNNIPLPGGEPTDTPEPRQTAPGGAPGGLGNAPAAVPPRTAGGVGDMMSFDGSRRSLMQQHTRNTALYKQTGDALKKLDVIRKSLERLSDKQDIVTMDDIVDEAGKLVSHGIDPMALAGLLADAPQEGGGEALGGWVASHAQTAMAGEQQMLAQHNMARHQMGVSAVHMLMASANGRAMMGDLSPGPGNMAPQEGNDLGLGGNGGDIPAPSPGSSGPANQLAMGARFMEKQ